MPNNRLTYAVLLLAALAAGLMVRFGPVHLPPFLYKYLGSTLWAIGVYLLLATITPRTRPLLLAFIAAFVSTAVECFKLVDEPAIDAFRRTLAGKILLGRFFSPKDLIAYYLAIAAVAALDHVMRRQQPL